jgi:hypothetical protein
MTVLVLLLALILIVGLAGAALLWRLLRTRPSLEGPQVALEALASKRSAVETYQPMSRLFAEEDFAFVSAPPRTRPGAAKRLRRQRGKILRLYLRELRSDFEHLYTVCRLLAPQSSDPNFAPLITQQALAFYGLWMVLQVRCSLGWFLHVRVDTVDLVSSFERLRQAAQATLQAMTPQPALAGGAA